MKAGETVRLSEQVEYQENSVVSQTLVKTEKGSVTLFAFDGGQALSEHRAPFDALVQILEGKACITISGIEHDVSAGEAILLPAQEPHAVRAITRFKMLLTMLRT
jgi:quercetin dioxygenase-like cupin family protein